MNLRMYEGLSHKELKMIVTQLLNTPLLGDGFKKELRDKLNKLYKEGAWYIYTTEEKITIEGIKKVLNPEIKFEKIGDTEIPSFFVWREKGELRFENYYELIDRYIDWISIIRQFFELQNHLLVENGLK